MNASDRSRRLLRWYPPEWRRRYGDEFAALLEDTIGEGAPSVRLRLNVMRAGLATRIGEAGLSGDGTPPTEWIRAGALTVLCAWSIFVVAGIALQKTAEHWQDAMPSGTARAASEVAFGTVQVLAGIASILVVAGAAMVMPAAVRFFGDGGWRVVRRRFLWAAVICAMTLVSFGGLVWWAPRLTEAQRNGGDVVFELSALVFAALVIASIATLTLAGVATARRLRLSPSALRLEGYLAEAVAAAMALMTVAACVWWGVTAASAPWFFSARTRVGQHGSPVQPMTVFIAGLMLIAVVLASLGTRRVRAALSDRTWVSSRRP